MNVFVLCAGRSGSVTFAKACGHFTNYSSGHETRANIIGPEARFSYPANHIEVDNHLSLQLGHLEQRYGDDAYYVHLTRDAAKTATSHARLFDTPASNVAHYSAGVLMRPMILSDRERMAAAVDYVATVGANIGAFLRDKSKQIAINIDSPEEAFRRFATDISAIGDLDAALITLKRPSNQKADRKPSSPLKRRLIYLAQRLPI